MKAATYTQPEKDGYAAVEFRKPLTIPEGILKNNKFRLKVKDLLHAVGRKCGIDPYVIDNMDLENIVERAVAINEGKEPPEDTNEEPLPPKEPGSPTRTPPKEEEPFLPNNRLPHNDFVIRSHFMDTIQDNSTSPTTEVAPTRMPFDLCNIVAIDMDLPEDYVEEQVLDWNEPIVIVGRPEQLLVERSSEIASPDELDSNLPIVILDESNKTDSEEPKKFKEKKQKYGRDPKKLYATYQEEWDRLERLSDKRLGPRRKSVLALNSGSSSPVTISSTIPVSTSPLQPTTITVRLNGKNEDEMSGTSSTRSITPTKVLSPPSLSHMDRRSTSPTPARLSVIGEPSTRDSSSRRSSSSAGIKKINPSIYKKFGEMITVPKKE